MSANDIKCSIGVIKPNLCRYCGNVMPSDRRSHKCKECSLKYTHNYYKDRKYIYRKSRRKYLRSEKGILTTIRNNERRKNTFLDDEATGGKIKLTSLYSRRFQLKKKGISYDEFLNIIRNQNYSCAICKKKFAINKCDLPYVDHNHKTNSLRGVLCFRCNTVLGHVNDDKLLLNELIAYLDKYSEIEVISIIAN